MTMSLIGVQLEYIQAPPVNNTIHKLGTHALISYMGWNAVYTFGFYSCTLIQSTILCSLEEPSANSRHCAMLKGAPFSTAQTRAGSCPLAAAASHVSCDQGQPASLAH